VAQRPKVIDLTTDVLAKSAVQILPKEVWQRLKAVGVTRTERTLIVAMANPDDTRAVKELEIRTGLAIFPARALETDIAAALERSYEQ
jgi:hypothetical protein